MQDQGSEKSKPLLLYLVSEDWYFRSHRLPMAQAAQQAGYDVHVATHVQADGAAIEALGFTLHPLAWRRGSVNPLERLRLIGEVRRLYRELKPDLVHHVALEPAVIGSLASTGLNQRTLNAFAGLGFVFTARTPNALLSRFVIGLLFRALLNRPHHAVLVQNEDDRATIAALGIDAGRLFMIPGSGVDTERLPMLPEPPGPPVIAFLGRLLEIKGVRTLVAAYRLLRSRRPDIALLIAG